MPHVLAWDIETVPDLRGYAVLVVSKAKSDDEMPTRWAAQPLKKHSTNLVPPECLKVVKIAQTVLFNSTHIVCNRGVR